MFLKGSVDETDQRFAIQDVVEFMKPELEVTVRWLCMATSLEVVPTTITLWFHGMDYSDTSFLNVILCPEAGAPERSAVTLCFVSKVTKETTTFSVSDQNKLFSTTVFGSDI